MCDTTDFINFLAHVSEDCLNLNVIIPSSAKPGANLPVYVYVYGGGVHRKLITVYGRIQFTTLWYIYLALTSN